MIIPQKGVVSLPSTVLNHTKCEESITVKTRLAKWHGPIQYGMALSI